MSTALRAGVSSWLESDYRLACITFPLALLLTLAIDHFARPTQGDLAMVVTVPLILVYLSYRVLDAFLADLPTPSLSELSQRPPTGPLATIAIFSLITGWVSLASSSFFAWIGPGWAAVPTVRIAAGAAAVFAACLLLSWVSSTVTSGRVPAARAGRRHFLSLLWGALHIEAHRLRAALEGERRRKR